MHELPPRTDIADKSFGGLKPTQLIRGEHLAYRKSLAVLKELCVECQILQLANAPKMNLSRARTLNAPKPPGNSLTMKIDIYSSRRMEEYLRNEIGRLGSYKDYDVCDVGFWDANSATDVGLGWHNDFNWNRLLAPNNRSFHGWFINSLSADCNFTLAVSTDCAFNECNSNVNKKIFYIKNDDAIKPDVVVPLRENTLILFPYGSAHRTYILNGADRLIGRRLSTSFVLHHKDDKLNDQKISDLTDDDLRALLFRYPLEKKMKNNHYIIKLLEDHSRTGPLVKKMLESY
jgi:hypothetical protein